MNRRYRMCYEYVRRIAATSNCPTIINLYARQNRWSIFSLPLDFFFLSFFFRIRAPPHSISFSPILYFFPPPFFTCFDYLPLLSRFNFNSFCSDYKANSIFHIQSIGEERRERERKRKGERKACIGIRGSKYPTLKSKSSTFTPP